MIEIIFYSLAREENTENHLDLCLPWSSLMACLVPSPGPWPLAPPWHTLCRDHPPCSLCWEFTSLLPEPPGQNLCVCGLVRDPCRWREALSCTQAFGYQPCPGLCSCWDSRGGCQMQNSRRPEQACSALLPDLRKGFFYLVSNARPTEAYPDWETETIPWLLSCFQILLPIPKALGGSGDREQRSEECFCSFQISVLTLLSCNFNFKERYLLPLFSQTCLDWRRPPGCPNAWGGRGFPHQQGSCCNFAVVSASKPSKIKPGWSSFTWGNLGIFFFFTQK